jgi:hypothetical protein
MRQLAIAAMLVLASCSNETGPKSDDAAQASSQGTPEDAAAGFSGVGKDRAGGELDHDDPALYVDAKLTREQILGTWSFDRTCASSDGMQINADGTAGYDEWGTGTWAINDQGQLVMTLKRQEPGTDAPAGDPVTLVLTAADPPTDELFGNIAAAGPDLPGRAVSAKRCPAQ